MGIVINRVLLGNNERLGNMNYHLELYCGNSVYIEVVDCSQQRFPNYTIVGTHYWWTVLGKGSQIIQLWELSIVVDCSRQRFPSIQLIPICILLHEPATPFLLAIIYCIVYVFVHMVRYTTFYYVRVQYIMLYHD